MILTAEVMLQILEKVPGEYEIALTENGVEHLLRDKVEVDVSGKKIILKY